MSGRSFRILGDTLREFAAANGPFLSAGLAFYVLLYCFPLLLLFITALGYVLERSELAMEATKSFVQTLFPASDRSLIDALESFSEHRGVLGLVTIVAFLLFGTFLFRLGGNGPTVSLVGGEVAGGVPRNRSSSWHSCPLPGGTVLEVEKKEERKTMPGGSFRATSVGLELID